MFCNTVCFFLQQYGLEPVTVFVIPFSSLSKTSVCNLFILFLEIWEYIKTTRAEVHDLENRLHKAKANVEQIQRLMSTWQDVPLYKRSEGKSTLLYLDDKEQRLNNRYKELDETGKKIHGLLKENGELLKVENYDTDAWRNYVDYVDQMVLEGFRKIVHCNLVFFLRETDLAQNPDPLFESQLQLQVSKFYFEFM